MIPSLWTCNDCGDIEILFATWTHETVQGYPWAWCLLTFLLHCVLKSDSGYAISKETQLKWKIQSRISHLMNLTQISRYLDLLKDLIDF